MIPDPFLWPGEWHTQTDRHGTICWTEEARSLFTSLGLKRCDQILSFANDSTARDRKGYRDVTGIEIAGNMVYLKRYLRPRVRELLLPWRVSHARREFEHYRILCGLGVATAVPLAWGENRGASFIVTRKLPGMVLTHYLLTCRDFSLRREFICSLAALLRKIHEAGYHYPDCKAKHIYILGSRIAFLDVERLSLFPWFRSRSQVIAEDLAALGRSVPLKEASSTERLYFVKCYLSSPLLDSRSRRLVTSVQHRLNALALARKWYLRLWRKLLAGRSVLGNWRRE